jgi:hypothetical protein
MTYRPLWPALALLAAACSAHKEPPSPPKAGMTVTEATDFARQNDPKLDTLYKVQGHLEMDPAAVDFTAWWEGKAVRAIQEEYDLGANGHTSTRYWYRGDTLVYCKSKGNRPGPPQGMKPTTARFELTMTFDDAGKPKDVKKLFNGKAEQAPEEEIEKALAHARELLAGVRTVNPPK